MAEYFYYDISFANKDEKIFDVMRERGFIKENDDPRENRNGEQAWCLDMKKINEYLESKGLEVTYTLEYDKYPLYLSSTNDRAIQYVHKWAPLDSVADSISKCFSDDVLLTESIYTGGGGNNFIWYSKKGEFTLKDGTPVTYIINGLKHNMLKEKENCYQISLPIGEDSDKWGRIYVPKENVYFKVYTDTNGKEHPYAHHVYFSNEKEKVYFRNSVKEMSVKDIRELYYNSKSEHRATMSAPTEIRGLRDENFIKMGTEQNEYYIVKIPCLPDISSNGFISVTATSYNVDLENKDVNLGEYGKLRKTRIRLENGENVEKQMTNNEIKQCYLAYQERNNFIENYIASEEQVTEEDAEIEL